MCVHSWPPVHFQSCFLFKIQLLMHTCFTQRKRKQKRSCYLTVVNVFYDYTLPQRKKSRGGGGLGALELPPPLSGLALGSELIFLHDTPPHGTPPYQVWFRHTDRRSDSNISPPPPVCIRCCGGKVLNKYQTNASSDSLLEPSPKVMLRKRGKSHNHHKRQHSSQSIIQASTVLDKLHA